MDCLGVRVSPPLHLANEAIRRLMAGVRISKRGDAITPVADVGHQQLGNDFVARPRLLLRSAGLLEKWRERVFFLGGDPRKTDFKRDLPALSRLPVNGYRLGGVVLNQSLTRAALGPFAIRLTRSPAFSSDDSR